MGVKRGRCNANGSDELSERVQVDSISRTTFVHEGTSVQRRGLQCRQIEVVVYKSITKSTGQSLLGEVDDCEESASERNEVCAL